MFKKNISSVTFWLVFINVSVFIYTVSKGLDIVSPNPSELIFWGGNVAPLTLTGDYWRLFTSMFQHGGILHLALNMLMLFQIGHLAEGVWGRARFSIIYLLTGLVGSATSALWYGHKLSQISSLGVFTSLAPAYIVSVGASGAILGIAGACLIHSLKDSLMTSESSEKKSFANLEWQALAKVVGINLAMGFAISGVDNACHLGGALSGMILAGGFLVSLPSPLKTFSFLRIPIVFLATTFFLYSLLNGPHNEMVEISRDALKEEIKSLEKKKEQDAKQLLYSKKAAEEELAWLPGVSIEIASGKSLVVEGGSENIVYNKDQTRAYVANSEENSVTILDLKSFKILKTFKGLPLPDVPGSGCPDNRCLGRGAAGIAVSKDEMWAIVSSMETDHVVFVDLNTGKFNETIKVGRYPRKILLSPNEEWAFVVNSVDNSVSVLDVKNKALSITLPLGESDASGYSFGRAIGIEQAMKKDELYLADPISNQLVVIRMKNPKEIWKTITLGDFSPTTFHLSTDEESLWVIGSRNYQSVIKKFETNDYAETDELVPCKSLSMFELSISSDGKWITLNDADSRHLSIVSVESLRTVRVFPSATGYITTKFSKDASTLYSFSRQGWLSALTEYKTNETLDVRKHIDTNGEAICNRQN